MTSTTTPDFSHLRQYAITDETTAEFTFTRIKGEPSVIVAPAHDVNKPYTLERIAYNVKLAQTLSNDKPGPLVPGDMVKRGEEEREVDRRLIANFCARGWGTAPVDSKGKEVEFSPENAYEFFRQIPPEMFDPLRNFAANLFNFYPERHFKEGDEAALGN